MIEKVLVVCSLSNVTRSILPQDYSVTTPTNSTLFYHSSFLSGESENNALNDTNWTSSVEPPSIPVSGGAGSGFPGKSVIIPLYTLIFFLSIIGNLLVIITLVRNRRMRTVTNVFLLNLAISDLLLGVFCVPVTLVGQVLRNFIFGHLMCKIIPYFQALAVSVGVYTLVAISLERYFAICRPLQSRKWQTRSHAYKMIVAVWVITLTWNIPILFVSQLQPIRNTGRYKCREIWPNPESEKIFNLILDFLLLLLPLCIMGMAYSLIVSKLWKGLRSEILHTQSFHQPGDGPRMGSPQPSLELSSHSHYSMCKIQTNANGPSEPSRPALKISTSRDRPSSEAMTFRSGKCVVVRWKRKNELDETDGSSKRKTSPEQPPSVQFQSSRATSNQITGPKFSRAIRSTYTGKSIESKKKVIRMLFVLVAEFFLAWTPLYVMNTWYLFNPEAVYHLIGPLGVSLIQLLAYASSCCNPITYCFMNRKQAFLKVFQFGFGFTTRSKTGPPTVGRGSDLSANDSLIYGVRGSTLNKSGSDSRNVPNTAYPSSDTSPDELPLRPTASDTTADLNADFNYSDGYVETNSEVDEDDQEFLYRISWRSANTSKSKTPMGIRDHLYS